MDGRDEVIDIGHDPAEHDDYEDSDNDLVLRVVESSADVQSRSALRIYFAVSTREES